MFSKLSERKWVREAAVGVSAAVLGWALSRWWQSQSTRDSDAPPKKCPFLKKYTLLDESEARAIRKLKLGDEVRRELFLLESPYHPKNAKSGYCMSNHGSFGSGPAPLIKARERLLAYTERNSDIFLRNQAYSLWFASLKQLSGVLGIPDRPQDLVFVPNATAGANVVANSVRPVLLSYKHKIMLGKINVKPVIMTTSHAYNAVDNTMKQLVMDTNAELVVVSFDMDNVTEDKVVETWINALEKIPETYVLKVVFLDHITSQSALRLPVVRIAEATREWQQRRFPETGQNSSSSQNPLLSDDRYLFFVDAAHSIGAVSGEKFNMKAWERAGVHCMVSNCHKWNYCPRACAVFWMTPEFQQFTYPLIVSHDQFSDDWQARFYMQGTMDVTTYICAGLASQLYDTLGRQRVLTYCSSLLDKVIARLTADFDQIEAKLRGKDFEPTGHRLIAERSMNERMAVIRLPLPDMQYRGYLPVHLEEKAESKEHDESRFGNAHAGPCRANRELPEQDQKVLAEFASQGGDLMQTLLTKHRVVLPIMAVGYSHLFCRVSIQCYNTFEEYLLISKVIAELADAGKARFQKLFGVLKKQQYAV